MSDDYGTVNSPEWLSRIRLRGNLSQRALDTPLDEIKRRMRVTGAGRAQGLVDAVFMLSADRQRFTTRWSNIGWRATDDAGHWGSLCLCVPRADGKIDCWEAEKLREGERRGTPSLTTWAGYDDVWHVLFSGKIDSPYVDRTNKPPLSIPTDTLCAFVILAWKADEGFRQVNRRTDFFPIRYIAASAPTPPPEPPPTPEPTPEPPGEEMISKAECHELKMIFAEGAVKAAVEASRAADAARIRKHTIEPAEKIAAEFRALSWWQKVQRGATYINRFEQIAASLKLHVGQMERNE